MVCLYASHAYLSIHILTFLLLSRWPYTNAKSNIATHLSTKPKTCPYPSLLISKACKGTASFSSLEEECIKSLTLDHRTKSASTVLELAKAALSLAMEKAEHTQFLIGSPKKPCFKSCMENYKDSVVEGLMKAQRSMGNGDVDETDDDLSLARDAADYCNMILSVDPDDTRSLVFAANVDVYNHITFVMSVADLL
ncbi:Plant invertase/pectin methylesterase inhibitor superfamily protein [Arabidopsis thaliana]|uniref:Expressed protein n=2 Tax=Arabidopsis thaliana TaxID=3702 RepID=Q9SKH8_ARATH|nr:Plant invertase/pectin methylesterase inhibitor superfamily protein [Arabidopsis thaliana]AAD26913.1 expressed protein [Arabidopsis thaliana]ABE65804.1 invertase/pectin methylesterase inhibitor family protein [Arabidopsis thaliana]AEC06161.1 Plant invertase/pectin methylesterase inhibitor superfamily protein [Arabidopsis thaliana]|eukprot:NP_565350.1 Plant invertase/pectin methylesterase inhibitor superfamily protein [Arabidopsis thaliana]